ncbi:MAG: hypothetical protein JO358_09675 [Alphaproteobacteria bacterium]|nr:hypothetical protein [Alphaproteobacteria bacterium]
MPLGRSLATMTGIAALFVALEVRSAPPPTQDPDWPCQQRLVPHVTAAAYWNGPSLDNLGDWRADPAVAELVRRLAPRNVSTQEGLSEITAFVQSSPEDPPRRSALVFKGLLEETDRERAALIDRLRQIGRRQRDVAALVEQLTVELDAIPPDAADETAAKRIDLQQRHDFTVRNFEEVQRTIRYACETPTALEARLGAWARLLQKAGEP